MASRNGRGRPPHPDILTPAEWQVLDYVRHGMTNRAIANRRGTSLDATKFHVANILDKLDIGDKRQLRHWRGRSADSPASRPINEGGLMEGTKLDSIGQVALPISDVGRAVSFYRDRLGMTHLFTSADRSLFLCGETRLFLNAGDDGKVGSSSVVYFNVSDIQATYADLVASSVRFESAPHVVSKRPDGSEEWMAFFVDPDDNLLALMSQVRPGGA